MRRDEVNFESQMCSRPQKTFTERDFALPGIEPGAAADCRLLCQPRLSLFTKTANVNLFKK